jgi:hypothetical protein
VQCSAQRAHARSLCYGSSCLASAKRKDGGLLLLYLVVSGWVGSRAVVRGTVVQQLALRASLFASGGAWRRCVNAQAGHRACRLQHPAHVGECVPVQQHELPRVAWASLFIFQEGRRGPACWRRRSTLDRQLRSHMLACSRRAALFTFQEGRGGASLPTQKTVP